MTAPDLSSGPGVLALGLLLGLLPGCGGDQPMERPSPLYGESAIRYPLEMWDRDIEGQTLLRVRVNELGQVDSVVVAESSGHPALDSAAIAGAREMRFTPARKGEKRVRVWAQIPVHFSKKPKPRN